MRAHPWLRCLALLCSAACVPQPERRAETPINYTAKIVCPTADESAKRAFNEATETEQKGDRVRAEALYREALQHDAKFCDAMDNLGVLLRRQGKIDEAIGWYEKSLALQPKNRTARMNLGVALRTQGKLEEALQQYTAMLEQEPDDAEGHYGIGLIDLDRGDWAKAAERFERAEKLYWVQDPDLMPDATLLKGYAQWKFGDCRAATASLKPIEKSRSDNGDLNYILGTCALREHGAELKSGVAEGTPWVDQVRTWLRRARAAGKQIDPAIARALRL